jgi:uncharacterized coiled-coil DUF342 family protein
MSTEMMYIISGIIGALIGSAPVWIKLGGDKRNTDADTAAVLTQIAMELVDPLKERIDAMEIETQKKTTEAASLTIERDELREQVEALRAEVEALRIEVDELRAENKSLKAALDKRRKPAEKKI